MATKKVKSKNKKEPVKAVDKNKKQNQPKGKGKEKSQFSEQFMPYIMGALGFVFLLFFIMNAVSYGKAPDEHLVGPVGFYFCKLFFGLLGWAAFLIPVLFIYLAAFWRKNCREGTLTLRCVLTGVLLVLLSAVIHVFVCNGNADMAQLDLPMLFETGAVYHSGGIVGGVIGLGLFLGLKLLGTIIISVVVFPLLIMLLVGVTPAYVAAKLKARGEDGKKTKKADGKSDKQTPEKSRRSASAQESDEDEDEDDEDEDDGSSRKIAERKTDGERKVRRVGDADVDEETGEVIEKERDEDGAEDDAENDAADDAKQTPNSQDAEDARDEREETEDQETADGDDLYVPRRPSAKDRRDRKTRQDEKEAANEEDEDFYADDKHHRTDTMEVSMDDYDGEDGDDDDEDLRVPPRRASRERREAAGDGQGKESFVVVVREQDRTAVHSTVDNRVDGLDDEEVVLPSGTGEHSEDVKETYSFPPIDLLTRGSDKYEADEEEIARNTETLRSVLESFHIRVKEVACSCGPTITRFEVKPDQGVRVRSIANLVDDIALGLAKSGVRIEAPIPGKAAVGIEVPTEHPATVYLRNLIESPEFRNHKSCIAACLGADVSGRPVIFDINKMPHLLVAGATGMGKSVCINSIIMSILYKATPEEVKLILIDPKKVEFTMYRDLPHLYAPIVSDPKKAAGCLNSAVNEMERRFELIEEEGVRNIAGYNEVIADDPTKQPMPRIVIIIDEFADLMMTASQEVETAVCRLAQKARAAGIHIIIGTQRPSVDVITGLIKANIPSRIAFTVASSRDSMTILDMGGAEKLIGRGDMLYAPVGAAKPMRVQGTFVSDGEVERVVTYLKENNNRVAFDENFVKDIELEAAKCGAGKKKGGDMGAGDFDALGGGDDSDEKMFWAAVEIAVEDKQISTSLLQRRLRIGFGKASRYIDRMEDMGFVGPKDGAKPRKTLISPSDLAEIRISGRTETEAQE